MFMGLDGWRLQAGRVARYPPLGNRLLNFWPWKPDATLPHGQRVAGLDEALADRGAYVQCVTGSLAELVAAGVIDEPARARFLASALAP